MEAIIPELVKTFGVEAIKLLPKLFEKLMSKKNSKNPELNESDINKVVESVVKEEGIEIDKKGMEKLSEVAGDIIDKSESKDISTDLIGALTRAGVKLTDPFINELSEAIDNLVATPSERSRGIGSTCSMHKQCSKSGFAGGQYAGLTDQVGCCENEYGIPTCMFKKYDWAGIAYCPHECVGKIFDRPGSCSRDVEAKSKYEQLLGQYRQSEYLDKEKIIDPLELASKRRRRQQMREQERKLLSTLGRRNEGTMEQEMEGYIGKPVGKKITRKGRVKKYSVTDTPENTDYIEPMTNRRLSDRSPSQVISSQYGEDYIEPSTTFRKDSVPVKID